MFSQIDVREASRPIDAIPRMAASWEASGSLAFVADRKVRWEVPYDDVYAYVRSHSFSIDSDLSQTAWLPPNNRRQEKTQISQGHRR
jgi:hypothetical protein